MSFLGGAIKLLTLATWLHGAVACVHDQSAEEIDSYERTLWSEALDGDRLLLHTIEFYQDLNTHLDSITDRRSAKKGIHRFAVFEQKLKTLGKRIDLLPPDRRKEFDARLKGSKELRSEMLRLMASGERIGKIPDADELVRPELEKLYRVR
jgi:hypothetical protein